MKELDWRTAARERNVPENVAQKLWEKAQTVAANDPAKAERMFRQLLDKSASAEGSREPGRETLVDPKSPRDATSLEPGKTTRVLEEAPRGANKPSAGTPTPGSLHHDLVAAVDAGKNAVDVLSKSDKPTIMEALQLMRAQDGPNVVKKVMSAAGGFIERLLAGALAGEKQYQTGAPKAGAPPGPIPAQPTNTAAPSGKGPSASAKPVVAPPPTAAKPSTSAPAISAAPAAPDIAEPSAPVAPAAATRAPRSAPPPPAAVSTPAAAPSSVVGNAALGTAREREVARITASFGTLEREIRANTITERAKLTGAAAAKATELAGVIDQRIATGRTIFATAKANLMTAARSQAALARRDAHDAALRLRASTANMREQALQKAGEESAHMMTAAQATRGAIVRSGVQTSATIKALVTTSFVVVDAKFSGPDHDALHKGLKAAGDEMSSHVQEKALEDGEAIVAEATKNGASLEAEAGHLFDNESTAKTQELENAIIKGGETVASQIQSQATRALSELSRAEQQYLGKLSHLKASSATVIDAGALETRRMDAAMNAQLADLQVARGGAVASMETVTRAADEQFKSKRPAAADQKVIEERVSQELTKLGSLLINDATASHKPVSKGATEAFQAATNAHATKLLASVDEGVLAKHMTDASTGFATQAAAKRALVQAMYNDAIVQAATPLGNKLQGVTAHWKEQTQSFRAHTQAFSAEAIRQHTELTTRLPTELKMAGLRVLNNQHPSLINTIKDALVGTAKMLVIGGAIVVGLWALIPEATIVGVGALVAMTTVGLAFMNRLQALPWDELSAGEKVGAVFASFGAGVTDTFGFTAIEEALTKTNSFTGEALNPREVQERLVNGSIQSVMSIFTIKAMVENPLVGPNGKGAPLPKGFGEEPAPPEPNAAGTTESKPAETKPTESSSTDNKPADSKPADSEPTASGVADKNAKVSDPGASKPADTKPADTKPADAKPTDTKAHAEPIDTKPADTKPDVTRPEKKDAAERRPDTGSATKRPTDNDSGNPKDIDSASSPKQTSPAGRDNRQTGIDSTSEQADVDVSQTENKTNQNKVPDASEADRNAPAGAQSRNNLIWVKESDLTISDSLGDEAWEIDIEARLPNGHKRIIATGSAPVDAEGRPLGGPEFVFDRRITIDGTEFRITIGDEATQTQLPLTKYALERSISAYKARFGQEPETLSGGLTDDNKRNFQVEFLKRLDANIPKPTAEVEAARNISFGRARIERGYTDISVAVEETVEMIEFGTPGRMRPAPAKIRITARKP